MRLQTRIQEIWADSILVSHLTVDTNGVHERRYRFALLRYINVAILFACGLKLWLFRLVCSHSDCDNSTPSLYDTATAEIECNICGKKWVSAHGQSQRI